MKRRLALAASLVLSPAILASAEDTNPKTQRLNVLVERSKAEPTAGAKTEQAQQPPRGSSGAIVLPPWGGGRSSAAWYIEQTDKVAKLSAEQKQTIEQLFEARDKALQGHQAAIAEKAKQISAQIGEAWKSKNQEAVTAAQKKYQELYAPLSEITTKTNAAIQAVLTAEQKTKLQEHRLAAMVTVYAPGITFTEAQNKQIKEAVGQAGDHEGFERKLPEILERTLTPEQASQVLRHRLTSFVKMAFGNAKLTPEQLRKVEERITDISKDHKRGLQFEPSTYNKVSEFVTGLLTDEQKNAQQTRFNVGVPGAGWSVAGAAQATGQAPPSRSSTAPGAPVSNPAQPTNKANPANPGAAKPSERKQPQGESANVKVMQIPNGGIQVIIGEANGPTAQQSAPNVNPEQAARRQAEEVQRRLQEMMKQAHTSHRNGMRERVRRQRDLTKQATKLLKKLDELDSDESPKARELWAQLERTQAELQQTFGGPQAFSIGAAPGQPAGARVVQTSEGPLGGTVTGGGFGGGMVSGGGIVSSGNVIVSSAQPQLQANPGAPHVRQLKVAAPSQNAAPQPSNAEVLKAIEALNARIKMLEEKISKSSK